MNTRRFRAALVLLLPLLALAPGGEVRAQSTGLLTIKVDSTGTIRRDACSIAVTDTVAEGDRTDVLAVRLIQSPPDTPFAAPFPLTVYIGARDTLRVAEDDSTGREYLRRTALRGSRIVVTRQDVEAALCVLSVEAEEESDPLEVDPAFELLAGVEFLSADAFQGRNMHIPAAARWRIPVRVHPLRDTVRVGRNRWDQRLTRYRLGDSLLKEDTTKRIYRHGNVYSILTGVTEFTQLLSRRSFLRCVSETHPRTGERPINPADCAPPQVTGDSVLHFHERSDSADWDTRSAWRTYGNFRWEWNLAFADRDVFIGPAVTLGFQTDPGFGSPEFSPLFTYGVSLTQVEITPEYWEERFQIQLLRGTFPNYAEAQVRQVNDTTLQREVHVDGTPRWHVLMSFQPITGYFLRGSAEIGEGMPDVARIAVVSRLDLEQIIRGVLGDKDPRKRK